MQRLRAQVTARVYVYRHMCEGTQKRAVGPPQQTPHRAAGSPGARPAGVRGPRAAGATAARPPCAQNRRSS